MAARTTIVNKNHKIKLAYAIDKTILYKFQKFISISSGCFHSMNWSENVQYNCFYEKTKVHMNRKYKTIT